MKLYLSIMTAAEKKSWVYLAWKKMENQLILKNNMAYNYM